MTLQISAVYQIPQLLTPLLIPPLALPPAPTRPLIDRNFHHPKILLKPLLPPPLCRGKPIRIVTLAPTLTQVV